MDESSSSAAAAGEDHATAASTAGGDVAKAAVDTAVESVAAEVSKATDEKAVEEADDDEGEEVVTLSEVLQQDALLSETADAVLGDASETSCSYDMGYIRQAVYACLTCTPDAEAAPETRAGICLACSYSCHEGHDLVELYTKRSFRCDCGNSKFPNGNPCKLVSDKAPTNERNSYSQNYGGKYCTCHRPYPDPERTTEEVMVQCAVCEDWLHQEHLFSQLDGANSNDNDHIPDNFDELICLECMGKHPFLLAYTVDLNTESNDTCQLEERQRRLENGPAADRELRPTFWPHEWRETICQCSKCVALLEKHGLAFLVDHDDSLHVYEANARAKQSASSEEMAERAFSRTLSHQQQVEMAIGYNHMKSSLQQYLSTFAAGGKTVRAEDIQTFFEDLKTAKRQKTEP